MKLNTANNIVSVKVATRMTTDNIDNYFLAESLINNCEEKNGIRLISIPLNLFKIDYGYQRSVDAAHVRKLTPFNYIDGGVVFASYRDGWFYIIDGQHRLYGVKKRFGDDYLVDCKVIRGLTQQEESKLFVLLNDSSKQLNYADKAKGLYYSDDETMVNLFNICKSHGVEFGIDDDKRASTDGRITAIKAIVDTYNKIGADQTNRLVRLLNDTWDGKSTAFRQEMIKAVGVVLSLYSRELDDRKFEKKLSKVNPTELIRMAKNDRVTSAKTEAKIARIMVQNYYNKGKGATPLEYRFGF